MELITLSIAGSTLVLIGQSCSLLHDRFFANATALPPAQDVSHAVDTD
jgi:hypothetical protein